MRGGRITSSLAFVLLLLLIALIVIVAESNAANTLSYPLPKLLITPGTLTVSGLSSGAFMAAQFHVAFSRTVRGAGIFAGGPYYCAQNDFAKANAGCMKVPSMIDLDAIQANVKEFENQGLIDPIENLKGQPVYLFSGLKDYVVFQGVMHKLKDQYTKYFGVGKMVAHFGSYASHAMVTNNYGGKCDFFGVGFIVFNIFINIINNINILY